MTAESSPTQEAEPQQLYSLSTVQRFLGLAENFPSFDEETDQWKAQEVARWKAELARFEASGVQG